MIEVVRVRRINELKARNEWCEGGALDDALAHSEAEMLLVSAGLRFG